MQLMLLCELNNKKRKREGILTTPIGIAVTETHSGIAGSTTKIIRSIDTKIFYEYAEEMENGTEIVNNP